MNRKIRKSGLSIRLTGIFLMAVTLVQYSITPSLLAQTVEDQVFSNEEKDPFENTPRRVVNEPSRVSAPEDMMSDKKAQDAGIGKIPYKDPRLACLLSLILPGGGEFYLRKDVKGIAFCLSTTTVYLLSFYYLYLGLTSGTQSNLWTGVVGSVLGGILHVVGMVESYNDAVIINEARYYFSE
ncbi:MAG: hypothetical protein KDK38_03620 [Leptospiraceae bacterium]|nr:hypothetical protein [Leptospiraceae bacterium]